MQKQVRIIKPSQRSNGKDVVYGITLQKEIYTFASGISYHAIWAGGDIILKSGTCFKADDKKIEDYNFKGCKIEVSDENSNLI